jgi:hypothetical protein
LFLAAMGDLGQCCEVYYTTLDNAKRKEAADVLSLATLSDVMVMFRDPPTPWVVVFALGFALHTVSDKYFAFFFSNNDNLFTLSRWKPLTYTQQQEVRDAALSIILKHYKTAGPQIIAQASLVVARILKYFSFV